jgi:hypothetical protein
MLFYHIFISLRYKPKKQIIGYEVRIYLLYMWSIAYDSLVLQES